MKNYGRSKLHFCLVIVYCRPKKIARLSKVVTLHQGNRKLKMMLSSSQRTTWRVMSRTYSEYKEIQSSYLIQKSTMISIWVENFIQYFSQASSFSHARSFASLSRQSLLIPQSANVSTHVFSSQNTSCETIQTKVLKSRMLSSLKA